MTERSQRIRTHVILDKEMVEAIDKLVGRRARSGFIGEAVREVLQRERFLRALANTAGIARDEDHPEWADVPKWVHDLRQESTRLSGLT